MSTVPFHCSRCGTEVHYTEVYFVKDRPRLALLMATEEVKKAA